VRVRGAAGRARRDVDDVRRHVARWRDGGAYSMPRDATAGAAARAEKAAKAKK